MTLGHIKTIIIVTILSIIINIGEITRPYLIKVVIDDYLSKGIYQKGAITIGMIGAIYIGIVIAIMILVYRFSGCIASMGVIMYTAFTFLIFYLQFDF